MDFLTEKDYDAVVKTMSLTTGEPWTIPITLTNDRTECCSDISIGQPVKLVKTKSFMALLEVSDIFTPDKELEAELVYQTTDREHPGVRSCLNVRMSILEDQLH